MTLAVGEMKVESYDIVIIGGGPAGLAAAASAREAGCESIVILERDHELGGILNQCIHNGFGLHTFGEELTGPEYADRFIKQVEKLGIETRLNTFVLDISDSKEITCMNRSDGLYKINANAIILAMGCRERSRGALNIPGFRPAGIFSAGTAQRFVNMEGYMPGREVVILGSGDIGLIMARRMMLEGAKVKVVAEIMPFSGGLKRNIVQCLDDYGIPLKLSHTVVDIEGRERVEGVTIAEVDSHMKPIPGTEEYYGCDTLLLSVGLIPENELSLSAGVELHGVTKGAVVNESLETSVPGIFACGNVLHVHDLVDYVSEEAATAGRNAASFVKSTPKTGQAIEVKTEGGVTYCVPSYIDPAKIEDKLTLRMRVNNVYKAKYLSLYLNGERIKHKKRPVMAPGEMESIELTKADFDSASPLSEILIKIE